MLKYFDPSGLDSENHDLAEVNRDFVVRVRDLVDEHLQALGARLTSTTEIEADESPVLERFHVLVAMALQHALAAADVADRLGITVSTVHRWAKGSFVPPQLFVRQAALTGIVALLDGELARMETPRTREPARGLLPRGVPSVRPKTRK